MVNGHEEIKIINLYNPRIDNIKDLYDLIQSKNFQISLFENFAVIVNNKIINFNIIINNVNNNSSYEMNYCNKIEYFILRGYTEIHFYKNYVYKTCYLENFISIELINNNIKYVKNIFETDFDYIFEFNNYSLYDYYLLLLDYIKKNKVILLEFEENNQIEIIFDKNLNYHIFLENDNLNSTILEKTKNKEIIVKIEEDLEEFRNYLKLDKNDTTILIEIERKINYRINKLKTDNDYVFL